MQYHADVQFRFLLDKEIVFTALDGDDRVFVEKHEGESEMKESPR
jgi:hypothetical protein